MAAFGELALKTEALDDILNKGCELVGRALNTALAKVMELLPDGKTFKARAGYGWEPGVIGHVIVTAAENSPEGLTLKDGAVSTMDLTPFLEFASMGFTPVTFGDIVRDLIV